MSEVQQIVARTRGIQWWIDRQIQRGKSNEEIKSELPLAIAFISGRLTVSDLNDLLERAQQIEGEINE